MDSIMASPAGYSRPKKRSNKISKIVLQEDEYVRALSNIIERDYFPETSKLKTQLKLLEQLESNLPMHVKKHLLNAAAVMSERESFGSTSSTQFQGSKDNSDSAETVPFDNLDLDKFFAQYTSEDNASFEQLREKDEREHRERYRWAYDDIDVDGTNRTERLALYYQGGRVLSSAERVRMDALLNGEAAVGDERPAGPRGWPYRARNQLMFPPELDDSRATCDVLGSDSDTFDGGVDAGRLAITASAQPILPLPALTMPNGKESNSTTLVMKHANSRVGSTTRITPSIQRRNTSLSGDCSLGIPFSQSSYNGSLVSVSSLVEAPHTPSMHSLADSDTDSTHDRSVNRGRVTEHNLVAMTPLLRPGPGGSSSDVEPPFTYGVICGMPVILDPSPEPTSSMPTLPVSREAVGPASSSSKSSRMPLQTYTPIQPYSQNELKNEVHAGAFNRMENSPMRRVDRDNQSVASLRTSKSVRTHGSLSTYIRMDTGAGLSQAALRLAARLARTAGEAAGRSNASKGPESTAGDNETDGRLAAAPFGGRMNARTVRQSSKP